MPDPPNLNENLLSVDDVERYISNELLKRIPPNDPIHNILLHIRKVPFASTALSERFRGDKHSRGDTGQVIHLSQLKDLLQECGIHHGTNTVNSKKDSSSCGAVSERHKSRRCSNCGKSGHTKSSCSKKTKKTKKSNYAKYKTSESETSESDSETSESSDSDHHCFGMKSYTTKKGDSKKKKKSSTPASKRRSRGDNKKSQVDRHKIINEVFQLVVKRMIESFVKSFPKETVINAFNMLNTEFIGLKDPIISQLSQVSSMQVREKIWEYVREIFTDLLQPMIYIINCQ